MSSKRTTCKFSVLGGSKFRSFRKKSSGKCTPEQLLMMKIYGNYLWNILVEHTSKIWCTEKSKTITLTLTELFVCFGGEVSSDIKKTWTKKKQNAKNAQNLIQVLNFNLII